jgi:uncharacterized protein YbjT (DUF2867 family)
MIDGATAGPQPLPSPVHLIGASGRTGAALMRRLLAAGIPVQPVVRDAARWAVARPPREPLLAEAETADLADTPAMRAILAGATRIVSTAHARTTELLLAAAPPAATLILLGSTRRFTRWPDDSGEAVMRGEAAFLASGRRGVMLHPTMIYGAQGEDNVQRLAALLRRLPVAPLPGGGLAKVQPIHQDDLSSAILAALDVPWPTATTLVLAGPVPVSYADFVRAVAAAAGLKPPRILPVPSGLLLALAPLAARLPFLPRVTEAEIRRLGEDKAFDVGPMFATLGIRPMSLEQGLARTFAAG